MNRNEERAYQDIVLDEIKEEELKNRIDILYLGNNMGNTKYRFFPRYSQAEKDYYDTFRWLVKLNKKYPKLRIVIKHHPGYYRIERDSTELDITKNTPLIYVDNQLDSYELCRQSKMVVCWFTKMILELNGYWNLAHLIWVAHRKKRNFIRKPCKRYIEMYNIDRTKNYPPAFYLDSGHRNKQFCVGIDDVSVHNCSRCTDALDLEIYEPYRLCNYKQFEDKVKEVILNGY